MLLWGENTLNPGKSHFAAPYDSAYGMPWWAYIATVSVILFIVIRVGIALKKEKKGRKSHIKRSKS